MRRALVAFALLAGACGTSRDVVDAGPPAGDGGVSLPGLSLVLIDQPFAPGALTIDFNGDFVAADAQSAVLYSLDSDGLGIDDTFPVDGGGSWTVLGIRTGRGGAGYLLAGDGTLYSLDLINGGASVFASLGTAPRAFAVRRDDDGVVFAPADGGVIELDGSANVVANFDLPAGEGVSDLACDGNGKIYASLASDGGCDGVLIVGDGGALLGSIGAAPCALALSHDDLTLWLASTNPDGGSVYQFNTRSLPASSAFTNQFAIEGLTPTQVVTADDGAFVAVLGAPSGNTVALGQVSTLAIGIPFRSLTNQQVQSAAGGVFGDLDELYVADPLHESIDIVH